MLYLSPVITNHNENRENDFLNLLFQILISFCLASTGKKEYRFLSIRLYRKQLNCLRAFIQLVSINVCKSLAQIEICNQNTKKTRSGKIKKMISLFMLFVSTNYRKICYLSFFLNFFVCLFACGFSFHSRIFHLYEHVTITGEGLQILTDSRLLCPFFSVPHLLWHGTSV